MTLINYDVLPRYLAECRLVIKNVLISSKYHMKLIILQMLSKQWSLLFLSLIYNLSDPWSPLIEFHAPIRYRRQWHHDEERSFIAFGFN